MRINEFFANPDRAFICGIDEQVFNSESVSQELSNSGAAKECRYMEFDDGHLLRISPDETYTNGGHILPKDSDVSIEQIFIMKLQSKLISGNPQSVVDEMLKYAAISGCANDDPKVADKRHRLRRAIFELNGLPVPDDREEIPHWLYWRKK